MLGDVIADVWQLQISSSGSSRAGLLHSCPALSVVSRPGPLSPLVGVSASVRALEIATNLSLSSSCHRRPAPAQIQRGLRITGHHRWVFGRTLLRGESVRAHTHTSMTLSLSVNAQVLILTLYHFGFFSVPLPNSNNQRVHSLCQSSNVLRRPHNPQVETEKECRKYLRRLR